MAASFLVAVCAILITMYVYHDPEEAGFVNPHPHTRKELELQGKTLSYMITY